MAAIYSSDRASMPAVLFVFSCLLRGTASALLSAHSSGSGPRSHLSANTDELSVTVSIPSSELSVLQEASSFPRRRHPELVTNAPRANVTLTLDGRLLLSSHATSENGMSVSSKSTDSTALQNDLSGRRGLTVASSTSTPARSVSPPPLQRSRARSALSSEQQSRLLPPEFLAFPVYWSNEVSGRRAGGGRELAIESPLAGQLVTTTVTPRSAAGSSESPKDVGTTSSPPRLLPTPSTPAVWAEVMLPPPPAGCDAPGGPPERRTVRCRELRLLRQQTRQRRRQAAQRRAQQELRRIIDLHLADVADSLAARTPAAARQLKRIEPGREPPPAPGSELDGRQDRLTTRQPSTSAGTPRPTEHTPEEDVPLLKPRRVPPVPSPRDVTRRPAVPEEQRQRKTDGTPSLSTAAHPAAGSVWVPVRVVATGRPVDSDRRREKQQIGGTARSAPGDAVSDGQNAGQGRWRTYRTLSPNSIRTAPDTLDKLVKKAIDPFSAKPVALFTTTIVPEGGMPITQKGVIPGLLHIPARVQFSCRGKQEGLYGNRQTACQVYHQCTADGKKYDYICGVGTAFNEKTSTCDHWYNTSCDRH